LPETESSETAPGGRIEVAAFSVDTDPHTIQAWAAALGWAHEPADSVSAARIPAERAPAEGVFAERVSTDRIPAERVPYTFPIRWLMRPEIRLAVDQAGGRAAVFQEAQRFDYVEALAVGERYTVTATIEKSGAGGNRLRVTGLVRSGDGREVLRMTTDLVLLHPAAPHEAGALP